MPEQILANPDVVEDIDEDTNNPIVHPDGSADQIPVDDAPSEETPAGRTAPVSGSLVEAPLQKLGADGPVDDKIVEDVPLDRPKPILDNAPLEDVITDKAATSANAVPTVALLDHVEADRLRVRWNEIQGKFVDEPRSAVQQADALVSDTIEKITQMFTSEHSTLESQWKQGKDVSTEELRKALQRYRSFFNRLVA